MAWPVWLAALWWGSLTTLGFGVVPLLFANLPTPAMAGSMAARLFEVQTWVSALLGVGLLMASRLQRHPDLAWRAGPHASGCGLLRQPSLNLANGLADFVNGAVFDGLVAKGDTTFALRKCRLQGFKLGL